MEFLLTVEYANRYRRNHPQAIFKIAKNNEQVFQDVCEDIGPPARMMWWCCSMFKTGPITRVINSLYRNQQILTLYGIRKLESVSRSKYNRIEDDAESVKIQQQTVASPIFFWKDINQCLPLESVDELYPMFLKNIDVCEKQEDTSEESMCFSFLYEETGFSIVENIVFGQNIRECLAELKPREQQIIRARYGFDDGISKTLEEVGTSVLTRSFSAK